MQIIEAQKFLKNVRILKSALIFASGLVICQTARAQDDTIFHGKYKTRMEKWGEAFNCAKTEQKNFLDQLNAHIKTHGLPMVVSDLKESKKVRSKIERKFADRAANCDGAAGCEIEVFVKNMKEVEGAFMGDQVREVNKQQKVISTWLGPYNASQPVAISGDQLHFEKPMECEGRKVIWLSITSKGNISFRWPDPKAPAPSYQDCKKVFPAGLKGSDYLMCQQFKDLSGAKKPRLIISEAPMT